MGTYPPILSESARNCKEEEHSTFVRRGCLVYSLMFEIIRDALFSGNVKVQ